MTLLESVVFEARDFSPVYFPKRFHSPHFFYSRGRTFPLLFRDFGSRRPTPPPLIDFSLPAPSSN